SDAFDQYSAHLLIEHSSRHVVIDALVRLHLGHVVVEQRTVEPHIEHALAAKRLASALVDHLAFEHLVPSRAVRQAPAEDLGILHATGKDVAHTPEVRVVRRQQLAEVDGEGPDVLQVAVVGRDYGSFTETLNDVQTPAQRALQDGTTAEAVVHDAHEVP